MYTSYLYAPASLITYKHGEIKHLYFHIHVHISTRSCAHVFPIHTHLSPYSYALIYMYIFACIKMHSPIYIQLSFHIHVSFNIHT